MFNLCNVLQFIIGRFNQGSFSGLNLVSNTYQGVSHAVFNFSDKRSTVKKAEPDRYIPCPHIVSL